MVKFFVSFFIYRPINSVQNIKYQFMERNLPTHSGLTEDHVSVDWQMTLDAPVNLYPVAHVKLTSSPGLNRLCFGGSVKVLPLDGVPG